ncbi:putative isocitrate dehydrogenase kinase/phosphatase [Burkholderia mallei]|nr:putative isocitrate dehydrogenase kinase/phosphatase [Burkholderia mallei]KOT16349.1 putative isocitrate dehydrogenase kinase/phosphatase [Burkholderia mallei]
MSRCVVVGRRAAARAGTDSSAQCAKARRAAFAPLKKDRATIPRKPRSLREDPPNVAQRRRTGRARRLRRIAPRSLKRARAALKWHELFAREPAHDESLSQTAVLADRLRRRADDPRELRSPLPDLPRSGRRSEGPVRARGLARAAAARARAHHVVRRPRARMRRAARGRVRRGEHRQRSLAADQAALHRPAHVAPPARMRGDVLQFGVLQDPAPRVLQQRFHLRAPGDLDRIHRERRARREAHVPRVLSGQRGARRDARADRHELPAQSAVRGSRARHRVHHAGDPRRVRRVRRSGEFPDPRAVVAVLPEQDRVRRRPHHQRRPRAAVRGADPPRARGHPRARHRAPAPRPVEDHLQLLALVFPRRHERALRVCAVPALDHAGQAEGGDLHVGRPAEAGQEPVLSRPAASPVAFERPLHRRARHQGARDARVHAAVVPVRVQDDQGSLPAAEGHDARADHGQVPARQAPRPSRPDGRHARILERRAAARAARRRARARARKGSAVADRIRGREPRHQAPVHRAPDGAAQPVSAKRQRCRDRARRARIRQCGEGADAGQHLPRRHAVQELRRDAPRARRVLRLRRDRIPDRLQRAPRAAATQRRRRDVGRAVVHGRPARHLPRNLRAVPARRPARARALPRASRGFLRSAALAGQQGPPAARRAARFLRLRAGAALLHPLSGALRAGRRGRRRQARRRVSRARPALERPFFHPTEPT